MCRATITSGSLTRDQCRHQTATQLPAWITCQKGLFHGCENRLADQIVASNREIHAMAMPSPESTVPPRPGSGTTLCINQVELTAFAERIIGKQAGQHHISISTLFEPFQAADS